MATFPVKFYLDENLSPEILKQLQAAGIDIIRGELDADDPEHLQCATDMERVVCTEDDDFLSLAASGTAHAGIIKGEQDKHSTGNWIKYLQLVHSVCVAEELRNTVSYVFSVD